MVKWIVSFIIAIFLIAEAMATPPIGSEFVVIVGNKNCIYCPQVVKKFQSNPLIVAAVRSNKYSNVYYIDTAKQPEYIEYYKVKLYPTTFIMRAIGNNKCIKIATITGNATAVDFIRFLNKEKLKPIRNIIAPIKQNLGGT